MTSHKRFSLKSCFPYFATITFFFLVLADTSVGGVDVDVLSVDGASTTAASSKLTIEPDLSSHKEDDKLTGIEADKKAVTVAKLKSKKRGKGKRAKPEKSLALDMLFLNILVAEDNVVNQKLLQEMLGSAGCTVTIAVNGSEAVKAVKAQTEKNKFHGILMDIQMPEMGGIEATMEIRKTFSKEVLPIIAVTTVAESKEFTDAGMNGHVTKPVEKTTLFATIRRHFNALKN